jgi:hypothetical protein
MSVSQLLSSPELFSLSGQNVLITGATRGVYVFVNYIRDTCPTAHCTFSLFGR